MQRALVTGGAGFIGSHVTAALLRAGFRVRVLDNLRVRLEPLPEDRLEATNAELSARDEER
jgi:nucleoside-diphosphate-sugar epimerase